jgi:hypothetical protein
MEAGMFRRQVKEFPYLYSCCKINVCSTKIGEFKAEIVWRGR